MRGSNLAMALGPDLLRAQMRWVLAGHERARRRCLLAFHALALRRLVPASLCGPYRETEMVNEVSVDTPAGLKHWTKTAEGRPARSATVQKRGPVVPVVSVSGWTIRNQPLVA
jgi:hypothetical protein